VHAEHAEICTLALAGLDARAALALAMALEAHIRRAADQRVAALREGRIVLPSDDAPVLS